MATPKRKPTRKPATAAKKPVARKKTTVKPGVVGSRTKPARKTTPVAVKKADDTLASIITDMKALYQGKTVHILNVPFMERDIARVLGAEWIERVKSYVYVGDLVPQQLKPYLSEDFSYSRWVEDQINGRIKPAQKPQGAYFTPKPHQVEGIEAIKNACKAGWRGFIEADSTGLGKGLHADTLIPTPDGFTTMGDLKVGDLVLGADGLPTKVIEKSRSQAKKFYLLTFSDGTKVKADEDHRWLTSTSQERARKHNNSQKIPRVSDLALQNLTNHLLEAQDAKLAVTVNSCYEASNKENMNFIRKLLIDPIKVVGTQKLYHPQQVLEQLERISKYKSNRWNVTDPVYESVKTTSEIVDTFYYSGSGDQRRKNHMVKNTAPFVGEHKDLPVPPYVLGVWLGDGDSYHGGITSADPEIPARVAESYPLQGVSRFLKGGKASYYRFHGLAAAIKNLYNPVPRQAKIIKRIPEEYLTASKMQRLELLKGLLDTDGSIAQKQGGVSFSQKNYELFLQVYSLICSFGWKATRREKKILIHKKNGTKVLQTYYELLFYPDQQVFHLPRKKAILEKFLPGYQANPKNRVRYITDIEEIEKEGEYYCISVDNSDHLYLCTESYLPTHNSLTGLLGVSEAAKLKGFTQQKKANLLIITPNGAVPHWRNTVRHTKQDNLRIMIINYEQYKKLLTVPKAAQDAKKTKTKNKHIAASGQPFIKWDFIICDESQKVKNYTSQRTQAFQNIAEYTKTASTAPFVVYMSATIGQQPLELAYLAPLIGQAAKKHLTMETWPAWLKEAGFHVEKKGSTWTWVKPASPQDVIARQYQKQDVERLGAILFNPKAPSIRRKPEDIAGWPELNRIAQPVELSPEGKKEYQKLWTEFRKAMQLKPHGKNPSSVLAEQLRFAQKASLLRVKQTVEQIIDLLDSGYQVCVSVRFIETLESIKRELKNLGLDASEFSGRPFINNEQERLLFQRGINKVILFTVEEAVSFHAKEQLPDGTTASPFPRATLIHDQRYSALSMTQITGRAHRDGQNSNAYFLYAEDTVEEKILNIMLNKLENMAVLSGDSEEDAIVEILDKVLAS